RARGIVQREDAQMPAVRLDDDGRPSIPARRRIDRIERKLRMIRGDPQRLAPRRRIERSVGGAPELSVSESERLDGHRPPAGVRINGPEKLLRTVSAGMTDRAHRAGPRPDARRDI